MQMLAGSGACSRAAAPACLPAAVMPCMALRCHHLPMASAIFFLQLSAMDVSVRTTMKGAAKCDKHCELQNSVNRQGLERILCFWDIPESMPASVSMLCCSSSTAIWHCRCECLCLKMRVSARKRESLRVRILFVTCSPPCTAYLLRVTFLGIGAQTGW